MGEITQTEEDKRFTRKELAEGCGTAGYYDEVGCEELGELMGKDTWYNLH